MKNLIGILFILGLLLAGCGGTNIDISIDEIPKYKDGESFPIVLSASNGDEAVTDLEVFAVLEMARMDHGIIEVTFSNQGDGTYIGDVELPMPGEWIANVELTQDGNTSEETFTFDVEEG